MPTALPAIRPMVAGIDIGSSQHWVCGPACDDGTPNVRVFATTTGELTALADWLIEHGVESVAIESTSVYRIPIYELLESRGLEVLLVNARQLHNVPGRKTDFSDWQWLQLPGHQGREPRTQTGGRTTAVSYSASGTARASRKRHGRHRWSSGVPGAHMPNGTMPLGGRKT